MSTHTPRNLLKLWKLEQLSVEMAVGHILQNLVTMQEMIDTIRRTVTQLGANPIVNSTQQDEGEPMQKGKQKPAKSG